MHKNTKTSMTHTVSSERTCRLPACLLVRKRSALADPYCQSVWNSVGSRALRFSGPLLSVSVDFYMYVLVRERYL